MKGKRGKRARDERQKEEGSCYTRLSSFSAALWRQTGALTTRTARPAEPTTVMIAQKVYNHPEPMADSMGRAAKPARPPTTPRAKLLQATAEVAMLPSELASTMVVVVLAKTSIIPNPTRKIPTSAHAMGSPFVTLHPYNIKPNGSKNTPSQTLI